MRIKTEQLPATLEKRGLASIYCISGDEPLQLARCGIMPDLPQERTFQLFQNHDAPLLLERTLELLRIVESEPPGEEIPQLRGV
ncbi:hypothetical protein D3C83_33980 [compost metagenome]